MEISGNKALDYTMDEAEKQFNLLEVHLKQSKVDPDFCIDCVRKHLNTIEGLAEEGIGFGRNEEEKEKFEEIAKFAKDMKKRSDIKKNGPEYAEEVRKYRKKLIYDCPSCNRTAKNLNTNSTYSVLNSYENNTRGEIMAKKDYAEVGVINAGQFIGKGVGVLAAYVDQKTQEKNPTVPLTWQKRPSTYINVVGGLALQLAGLFALKGTMRTLSIITGSHMLTYVVDVVQEATASTAGISRLGARRAAVRIGPRAGGAVMPPRNGLVQID